MTDDVNHVPVSRIGLAASCSGSSSSSSTSPPSPRSHMTPDNSGVGVNGGEQQGGGKGIREPSVNSMTRHDRGDGCDNSRSGPSPQHGQQQHHQGGAEAVNYHHNPSIHNINRHPLPTRASNSSALHPSSCYPDCGPHQQPPYKTLYSPPPPQYGRHTPLLPATPEPHSPYHYPSSHPYDQQQQPHQQYLYNHAGNSQPYLNYETVAPSYRDQNYHQLQPPTHHNHSHHTSHPHPHLHNLNIDNTTAKITHNRLTQSRTPSTGTPSPIDSHATTGTMMSIGMVSPSLHTAAAGMAGGISRKRAATLDVDRIARPGSAAAGGATGGVFSRPASAAAGMMAGILGRGTFSDTLGGKADAVCLCKAPPKVPRPRNAFILYRQHHQAAVSAENPKLSNPDISRIIGKQWRNCPTEVQEYWKALAEEEKQRHQLQYPEYRYQPRRGAKAGTAAAALAIGISGAGGRHGSSEDGSTTPNGPGRCPTCKGRYLASLRTPGLTGTSSSTANQGVFPGTPTTTATSPSSHTAAVRPPQIQTTGPNYRPDSRVDTLRRDSNAHTHSPTTVSNNNNSMWNRQPTSAVAAGVIDNGDYDMTPTSAKRARLHEPATPTPTSHGRQWQTSYHPQQPSYGGHHPHEQHHPDGQHHYVASASPGVGNSSVVLGGALPVPTPTSRTFPLRATEPASYSAAQHQKAQQLRAEQQRQSSGVDFDETLRLPPLKTAVGGAFTTIAAPTQQGHEQSMQHPRPQSQSQSQNGQLILGIGAGLSDIPTSELRRHTSVVMPIAGRRLSVLQKEAYGLKMPGYSTLGANDDDTTNDAGGSSSHVIEAGLVPLSALAVERAADIISGMNVLTKINVLAYIAPPLPGLHPMHPEYQPIRVLAPSPESETAQCPSSSSDSAAPPPQRRQRLLGMPPRGVVIAVESSDSRLLTQIGGLLEKILREQASNDVALKVWSDSENGSDKVADLPRSSLSASTQSPATSCSSTTATLNASSKPELVALNHNKPPPKAVLTKAERSEQMVTGIDSCMERIMHWHTRSREIAHWVNSLSDLFGNQGKDYSTSLPDHRSSTRGIEHGVNSMDIDPPARDDDDVAMMDNESSSTPSSVARGTKRKHSSDECVEVAKEQDKGKVEEKKKLGADNESNIKTTQTKQDNEEGASQENGVLHRKKALIPVALLPRGFSLTITDRNSLEVPIADRYAPIDHWRWMATLWRGVVGPDVTVLATRTSDEVNPEGNKKAGNTVEFVEGNVLVVRVDGDELDSSLERRITFEVLEWVRTGRAKVDRLLAMAELKHREAMQLKQLQERRVRARNQTIDKAQRQK